MQNTQTRALILLGVLALGCGLLVTLGKPPAANASRWPAADALYAVPAGWSGPRRSTARFGIYM